MKKRQVIVSFEAKDIQLQIAKAKHKGAKDLLEFRLRTTYLESMVDLEKKRARIISNLGKLEDMSEIS